jgi:hypothetical protein
VRGMGRVLLLCVAGCGAGTNRESTSGTATGGSHTTSNRGSDCVGWGGCLVPHITLDVSAAADAGALSNVEANLLGPTPTVLDCEPVGSIVQCQWPSYDVIEGIYSLSVTASGFQTVNVSVTLALTGPSSCGCVGATVEPSTVILNPA